VPRYRVRRTFPEGLQVPLDDAGAALRRLVVERNAEAGVTRISSFVSHDRTRSFCLYDARSPEAIRATAARNSLPVDEITRVSVLDHYCQA